MDLDIIDNSPSEKGVSFFLKDALGNETDIEVTVIDLKSNKAQKLIRDAKKKDDESTVTALLTVGWKNLFKKGIEIKYSHEEAVKFYRDYPLFQNQVSEFILNEQSFLKKN